MTQTYTGFNVTTSHQHWNTVYENNKHWGNEYPTDFLDSLLPTMKPNARVLDLGCGVGRNALYLAQQGLEVHALDISEVAVEHLRAALPETETQKINVWRADLRIEEFIGYFDAILAYGILNSIERHWWTGIIERMKKHTVPGGYNVVVVFNSLSDDSSVDGIQVVTLADPAEISTIYSDWDMLKSDIRTIRHRHGSRSVHTHVIERYIFLKPLTKKPSSDTLIDGNIQSVAVIGPTRPIISANAVNIKPDLFSIAANDVGTFIAKSGRRLVCIPDSGIGRQVFDAYSANIPVAPALVLKPNQDEQYTKDNDLNWENQLQGPYEILRGFSWEEQASVLAQYADIFIVVGLSCGTLIEILWTNWKRRPVYMSLDLCTPLPREIRSRLSIFELPTVLTMMQAIEMHHPAKTVQPSGGKGQPASI
jgi:tellurite methyltransferase